MYIDARPPSGPITFRMSGINMASKRVSKNHTTDSTRALKMCLDSTGINLHPVDECISLMVLSKANLQIKSIYVYTYYYTLVI